MPSSAKLIRRFLVGCLLVLTAAAAWAVVDWYAAAPRDALATARYVGRASCVECHQDQARAFHGSDHDRAMELATDETVLADFNDTEFHRFEERTRFFRDGKRFMVNAEGPDGKYHDYEVKYTFGVRPLQQYMVEFPDGRIQVLRASWDVAKKQWFYVAPPDAPEERIEAGDPFHWTGLAQNWNTMCAECHSTDYHKNYNLAANTYDSKYKEIDVSCEACHGPGSLHVELATSRSLFWDRNVRYGLTNTLKGASSVHQVETCAPCHSQRAIVHPDYRPGDSYFDFFEVSLLNPGVYHADGQILDEVYEFGSFTQSKMYHKGVRCTDCHDPHSLELKFDGNRLCSQCHQPGKYDGVGHHHHPDAASGAAETQCVTCHMPSTTYMGIDERRDHSIRVPRPDLTVAIGAPNACNRCHTKAAENAAWAAEAVVEWFGEKRPDDPHFATSLHAAATGQPDGVEQLERLLERAETPDIVRATAVEMFPQFGTRDSARRRRAALDDASALVRSAAIRSYASDLIQLRSELEVVRAVEQPDLAVRTQRSRLTQELTRLIREVSSRLNDSVRTVRMTAATVLAANAQELVDAKMDEALAQAVGEFRAGQQMHLDRGTAHANLARLSLELGDDVAAVESFRTAIERQPERTQLRTELTQILARLAADRKQSTAWQEVGGSKEEIRRLREEEVALLERDKKLLPGDAHVYYHRGQLLFHLDRIDEAREEFKTACELAPDQYDYWKWLALLCEQQKRWEEGVVALKQMMRLRPASPEWQLLRRKWAEIIKQDMAAADDAEEKGQSAAGNDAAAQPPAADPADPAETDALPPIDLPTPSTELAEPPVTPGQKQLPTAPQE